MSGVQGSGVQGSGGGGGGGVVGLVANSIAAAVSNNQIIAAALAQQGEVSVLTASGAADAEGMFVVYVGNTPFNLDDFTSYYQAPNIELRGSDTGSFMFQSRCWNSASFGVISLTYDPVTNLCTCVLDGSAPFAIEEYAALNWIEQYGYGGVSKVLSLSTTNVTNDTFTFVPHEQPAVNVATDGTFPMNVRKATQKVKLVIDGVLNYNTANRTLSNERYVIQAYGFKDWEITVNGSIKNSPKYCVNAVCYDGLRSAVIRTAGDSDGLHITGPANGTEIAFASGSNGDNQIGIGTGEYAAFANEGGEGAVTAFRADLVTSEDGGLPVVSLFGSDRYPMDVHLGDLINSMGANGTMLLTLTDPIIIPNGNCWVRKLIVDTVTGGSFGAGSNLVLLSASRQDYISIGAVTDNTPGGTAVAIGNNADTINLRDIKTVAANGVTNYGCIVFGGANVKQLSVEDSSCPNHAGISGAGSYLVFNSGSIINMLTFNRCDNEYAFSFFGDTGTSTTDEVNFDNCRGLFQYNLINLNRASGATNFVFKGGRYAPVNGSGNPWIINNGAGKVIIRSHGSSWDISAGNIIGQNSTGTAEVYGFDIPLDVGLASIGLTATRGQYAYHTSAVAGRNALAQQGNAILGANWYALATGAAGVNTLIV